MKAETAIHVARASDMQWSEAVRNSDETDPPGREATAFADRRFSVGLWERDVQRRHFQRPHHEVAYIIEGQVEITTDDGEVVRAGPGDILITPKGSKGYWQNLSRVRKVWAIYEA
jgi:uncharacterized cupin superfamily protein